MLFSSIVFLFTFLPAVVILYYLLPVRFRNVILLLASLVFYAWGEPVYLFLMLLSILFNYFSGLDIARNLQDKRAAKRSLVFNLIINLAVLGFFKYEGFVLDTLNGILPVHISYHALPLPIGISFYTFQILSYIIDVYRGNVKVQTNLLNFALYVTMFPQLIAGPIVQYADVDEQLASREVSRTKFGEGSMYFIRGLAKKVLLANTSGMIFTEVSGLAKGNIAVMTAWLGAFAYMFQIYFDFSGYSDMAIGLGKMFGFEFNMNFNYPYVSKSITEFWRRWHISLSSWFRDYVYIPLGGNRVSKIKHIRNLLIVWFLTSGYSPSYLQYCSGCDRLGIVFQLFIRTGSRLYQSDVWCRCTWLCRQREYVSSYKQPDPVADPDIWLYAAGSFQIRAYVKIKKMEYNNH